PPPTSAARAAPDRVAPTARAGAARGDRARHAAAANGPRSARFPARSRCPGRPGRDTVPAEGPGGHRSLPWNAPGRSAQETRRAAGSPPQRGVPGCVHGGCRCATPQPTPGSHRAPPRQASAARPGRVVHATVRSSRESFPWRTERAIQPNWAFRAVASLSLLTTPTKRSTTFPPLNTSNAGMALMLYSVAIFGLSSVFNLPTRAFPRYSPATASTVGAIILQGPHQGAQKSTSTG